MKLRLCAALAVLPFTLAAQEQRLPQVSPSASVTQRIGLSDVTITYHRPSVKGRKVWGELVPYGKVWRTGANEATTITFGEDVLVEGQAVPAGTYALFTIPGEKEWTLILDKNAKQFGAFAKKDADEVLRVKLTPRAAAHEEAMSFRFEDPTIDKATVVLAWEKVEVPFTVKNKLDPHARVLAGFRERISKRKPEDWTVLTESAEYCVDYKVARDEARQWLDTALSVKDTTFSRFVKARLLDSEGKTKEGIAELEHALKVAGKDDGPEFLDEIKAMIASWKKKV